jgi:hypothetical protein
MTDGKTDVQIVKEILDELEGHPNFVKANRILDELSRRTNEPPNREKEAAEDERRKSRHS